MKTQQYKEEKKYFESETSTEQRTYLILEALCCVIDSFWSSKATVKTQKNAADAIRLVLAHAEGYVEGMDKDVKAICTAEELIENTVQKAGTAAVCAMGRKLSEQYQISKGQAEAAILPAVWRLLLSHENMISGSKGKCLEESLQYLTRLFGMEAGEDAVRAFEAFCQSLVLEPICISKEDARILAKSFDKDAFANFPIELKEEDICGIYLQIREGQADISYLYWYVASRRALLWKAKDKTVRKTLNLSVQRQDENRRIHAANCILKNLAQRFYCLEEEKSYLEQEYFNLTGSLISYCQQFDAGMYYFKNRKKRAVKPEEAKETPWTWKVKQLSELLQIEETRAFIYVMEAAFYAEASRDPKGRKLAKAVGTPDNLWAYRAIDGMVRQLGLHEFHYFDESEEKELAKIWEDTEAIKHVFSEQQEQKDFTNILSFCYLETVFEKKRYEDYLNERISFCQERFSAVKKYLEAEHISYEWEEERCRILISEKDAEEAAAICADKNLATGDVKQSRMGVRLCQKDTLWMERYDAAKEEAFLEISWNGAGEQGSVPYLARFSERVYAFDEQAQSLERKKNSLKESIRSLGRVWKNWLNTRAEASMSFKEFLRSAAETRKQIAYKLFYKYRYEVDDKIVLFESYHGDRYNCNPRGIYEAMIADERYIDYKFIWAFKDPDQYKFLEEDFRTKTIKSNSRRYYIYCAKAKYIVLNLLLKPQVSLKKEQTYIQTWHGKPIKAIGCGRTFETDPRRTLASTRRHYTKNAKKITKLLSPSAFFTPVMRDAFNIKKIHKEDCICETGYARNDELFRYSELDKIRIRQKLGVDPANKVILYAPTWRELFGDYIENQQMGVVLRVSDSIDFRKMKEQLGDGYTILFRAHHMDAEAMDISRYEGFIIDVTDYENVNDLYIISDLMISDYSGTIFDFGILKRPMVYYMFDRELYTTKLQGVNIDLDELPGIAVEKEEELVPAIIKQFREFQYDEKYERFNRKYNQYEDGHAGERVIELCMPDTIAKKTFTSQYVLRSFKKGPLYKAMQRLKLNIAGILREKGIIHDKNTKKLLALKNKYQGQKCYLIGNGPSLNAKDLDLIQNEISFGCNMVYKIFEKTKWRPTYHFIVDVVYTSNLYLEIKNNIQSPLITNSSAYYAMKQKPKNITYVNLVSQDEYRIRGNMMAYYITAKATVMTFMIEMAIFMGFKEIYLLGTDCTNSFTSGHFGEAYTATMLDKVNLARAKRILENPDMTLEDLGEYRRERSIQAYEKIAEYAKKQNVKIYNATRGGALEVFERVRLEDTLK